MPSNNTKYSRYVGEKGTKASESKKSNDLSRRNKELEAKLKVKEREIKKLQSMVEDEKEKVDILKKSLHIFMQQPE